MICGPFGSAIKNTDYQDSGIPLIRIANISKDGYMDYSDIVFIPEKLGDKFSRTQVSPGDVVVSQRGSLGQCAVIDNTYQKLNISANIIAIKSSGIYSSTFIRDYILSNLGQSLLERNVSGQVQQKITTKDIAEILIPLGCDEANLTKIIQNAHRIKNNKIKQADELLKNNSETLMNVLGLKTNKKGKTFFAVRYKELDGVIDAKRYMNLQRHSDDITVYDVCDVLDVKVSASSFGERVIDWIRIDDLNNQPLDIDTVRTQPANEVEGSFFAVQENDILVARLGPTIMNQKIVMVRNIERTTIASSEFLVLRCKQGYNPEAVMAVLKTAYYRDLMYSHSRGSTPSRYRLNREDMLKLPFPKITDKQNEIAEEAKRVRNKVVSLRVAAEKEWQEAKMQFEKELLGY